VGHGDVGDNYVRLERFGGGNHRAAVLYHADEIELGNQQAFQSLSNDPVIIRK
jgi:hypothetical protein